MNSHLFLVMCVLLGAAWSPLVVFAADPPRRPNIVWITCEDISPDLGCYGAALLTGAGKEKLPELVGLLSDEDPAVRYWAAVGLAALAKEARPVKADLMERLDDNSPIVRLAAAEALHRLQTDIDVLPVAVTGLAHDSPWVRLRAASLIERLGEAARPALPAVKQALNKRSRFGYENRLLGRLAKELEPKRRNPGRPFTGRYVPPSPQRCRDGAGHYGLTPIGNVVGRGWGLVVLHKSQEIPSTLCGW